MKLPSGALHPGAKLPKPLGLAPLCGMLMALAAAIPLGAQQPARWIWSDLGDPAPRNRFTYFRKVVDLRQLPEDATLRFAADSNAALWVNGQILRRKVARYHEEHITAEVVNAGPHLRVGRNVVVVRHHNWGDITTFQRTGNKHAGLNLESSWVKSDSSWRWKIAPQYLSHEDQLVGLIEHERIRYPQIVDGRRNLQGDLHSPKFDDSQWETAQIVDDGPWSAVPRDVETPGQREYPVRAPAVIAAGTVSRPGPLTDDPKSMGQGIRTAEYHPAPDAKRRAEHLAGGGTLVVEGRAGESHYVTFDFHRPLHGYPYLKIEDTSAGVMIDVGYAEIARSLYDGSLHAKPNGWINPEGVIGKGYADRYITSSGRQYVEIPDERTGRWVSIHFHFESDGEVRLDDFGFIQSQYPIRPVGSFSSGHDRIDQIVKLGLIHAEVSMSDAYVDTTGREDGQWIEDARMRAVIGASWFGDTRLRELMIRTIAESQGEDGNFHPFPPANFPAYPARWDWSVQWAAILYDDYLWSGETKYIEHYFDVLVKYWDALLENLGDDGIWREHLVLADIRVGVHPEEGQSSGIVTPFVIERLRWSAEMATAIGKPEHAQVWTDAAQRMANAFVDHHLAEPEPGAPRVVAERLDTSDRSLERGFSQAGQTLVAWLDLLAPGHVREIIDYSFRTPDGQPPDGMNRWNNPSHSYRVLRAMSEAGRSERAVAHLIERYAPYLPNHPRNLTASGLQGPYGGPLPEYWITREDLGLEPGEINTAQPDDETGSHGWGAMPLQWMHDTLLGVRITSPGGGKISIAPDAGGLPYVSGHTMTPKGLVWVHWDTQQKRLEVEIPRSVQARVRVPGDRAEVVQKPGEAAPLGPNEFQILGAGAYAFQVFR